MVLSGKQIKQIKKDYPHKTIEQITGELNCKQADVYKVLGLHNQLWGERCDTICFVLICGAVLLVPFVFSRELQNFADLPQRFFVQAATVVVLLVGAVRLVLHGTIRLLRPPFFIVLIGFTAWVSAATGWAHNTYEAYYVAVHWISCAVVCVLVCCYANSERRRVRLLECVGAAALGVILLGLGQQFLQLKWVPVVKAPAAAFANPNMAAQYVVIVLPVFAALGLYYRKTLFGIAAVIACLLACLLFYYTQTRAALVALAAGMVWLGVLWSKKRFGSIRTIAWGVALCISLIFVSAYILEDKKRLDGSAWYRLIVWQNCIEMIKDRPVLGLGPGGFQFFYPAYTNRVQVDLAFDKKKQIRRVHNDFLQLGAELGI
ncbi:MAG: O-antigen ligase family protein, partial [bacterium]|nr:O-antigen ligase family protein [bacterium]